MKGEKKTVRKSDALPAERPIKSLTWLVRSGGDTAHEGAGGMLRVTLSDGGHVDVELFQRPGHDVGLRIRTSMPMIIYPEVSNSIVIGTVKLR